jgi:hypothetical protein
VNQGGFAANHSSPAVAVNKDGWVAVSWMDRRDDSDQLCYRPYIAISTDGGQSFVERNVSSGGGCPGDGSRWMNGGETHGLAALADGSYRMIWTAGAAGALRLWSTVISVQRDSAALMADRMLAAIGGRARWAAVTNTINDSQQNRLDEPTVVRSVIAMDFARRRFRIETTAPGLRLVRVIDGEEHWRLTRAGGIEGVPVATLREDLQWYAGHVYRTLHRIAARDAALRLSIDHRGRLQVHEGDSRIVWFAVDARGEPYAFGAHDDDIGSVTGPWDVEVGGIRHPVWVARPDGSWRAQLKALRVNVVLPDSLFARPPK